MQSQNSTNNSYMWTPASDLASVGTMDEDIELFGHLANMSSSTTPNIASMSHYSPYNNNGLSNTNNQQFGNSLDFFYSGQQPEQSNVLPLVAPLSTPSHTNDLSDAVSRMNMEDQYQQRRNPRLSLSSNLSLDIQPCISITEPTPINRAPTLNLVDQFIAQHSVGLSQQELQYEQQQQQQQQYQQQQQEQYQQQQQQEQYQQQQEQYQQQQEQYQQQQSFSQLMDPNMFIDDLLAADTSANDWLSWTPARGSSPVSVNSNSFDDQSAIFSTSNPDPSSFYFHMAMASSDIVLGSTNPGLDSAFPSPSLSDYSNYSNNDNSNTLVVKKANRSRRVSEPPKPSNSIFQEHSNTATDRSVRRTHSEKRSRSNSNSSVMMSATVPGNHTCPHPGCEKSFTRPYNLTSHMRTHTSERPFACSQCGRKFARQHDRNRHEKLHWGIKPYACSHCKKPFARMDALNRHLRVENGCSSNNNTSSS